MEAPAYGRDGDLALDAYQALPCGRTSSAAFWETGSHMARIAGHFHAIGYRPTRRQEVSVSVHLAQTVMLCIRSK